MDILVLLYEAQNAGLEVHSDGAGSLVVTGPERLAPLVHQMQACKIALLDVWEAWSERAAIMEYDGSLARGEAEQLAWACVGGHMVSARLG